VSLSDVKHQAAAQRMIQRALQRDRFPHAYIFHGPDGVGKEMVARGLGQLLLCPAPAHREFPPRDAHPIGLNELRMGCGTCADCRMVMADTHPDWHLIYRQLNRDHPDPDVRKRKGLDIGVDVLRHFVIDRVALTPSRARAKVFVIREADRITPQAQNALLKTLEEPPGTTFIILLAASLDRLLATTQSRCQVVAFDILPADFVMKKLGDLLPQLSGDQREWYSRMSDGSLGLALESAEDQLFDVNQRVVAELAKWATGGGSANSKPWMEEAESLGERHRKRDPDITDTEATRRGMKTVFRLAAAWFADVIRVSQDLGADRPSQSSLFEGAPASARRESLAILNQSQSAPLAKAAAQTDAETAAAAIQRIVQAERQLDLNATPQLIMETLVNDLVRISIATVRDRASR